MMSIFAEPVKATTNNFLKKTKLGRTWKLMDPQTTAPTENTTNNDDDDKTLRLLVDTCWKRDEGRYETGFL